MRLVISVWALFGMLTANAAAAHLSSGVLESGSRVQGSPNEFLIANKPSSLRNAARSSAKAKIPRPNHAPGKVARSARAIKPQREPRRVFKRKSVQTAAHGPGMRHAQTHGRKLAAAARSREQEVGRPTRPMQQHEANAFYYGRRFEGRRTASGRLFRNDELTAASSNLPLGTKVQVTNQRTGRQVQVQVTDRMSGRRGKAIDLSERAARQIGMHQDGTALVRLTVLE